jgi:TetR/AcrR family transcriptional repressor of nem operon
MRLICSTHTGAQLTRRMARSCATHRCRPLRRYEVIALVGYHSERDFIPGCLIGNLALELAATNEAARGKLRQLFAHWTAGITARLTEARRAEAAPHDSEPEEVAAALIDAFEGAVLRAKVDRSRAALGRFENLVLPLFLRYSFAS